MLWVIDKWYNNLLYLYDEMESSYDNGYDFPGKTGMFMYMCFDIYRYIVPFLAIFIIF